MIPEHLDVLVVGAGISGIDAGWHLKHRLPGKTFAILEARDVIGGTWSLFRYPGLRSDSDMYTFGYGWRPWPDARSIADGPSIMAYLRDAVRGHEPAFPGRERFRGRVVHPQAWPDDLDWAGRRVVVIGGGATAVTLVPAMATDAAHVTMLQRSPTWILSLPAEDAIARWLGRVLPARARHALVREKNVRIGRAVFAACRRWPDRVGAKLLEWARRQLPPGYPVERDFRPRYRPWEQRLCLVPDGDFFRAIRSGRASVVTDHVESFDEGGIRLRSGARLDADVIVTATGLELKLLAGLEPVVDGEPVRPASKLPYRGIMIADVPNLAMVFGYTNASWTLRADLVCDWACRVIAHLDRTGARWAVPRTRPGDEATEPFVDFSSGYFQRAMDRLPKQGKAAPWRAEQDYLLERRTIGRGDVDDGVLRFEGAAAAGDAERDAGAAPPDAARRAAAR